MSEIVNSKVNNLLTFSELLEAVDPGGSKGYDYFMIALALESLGLALNNGMGILAPRRPA